MSTNPLSDLRLTRALLAPRAANQPWSVPVYIKATMFHCSGEVLTVIKTVDNATGLPSYGQEALHPADLVCAHCTDRLVGVLVQPDWSSHTKGIPEEMREPGDEALPARELMLSCLQAQTVCRNGCTDLGRSS